MHKKVTQLLIFSYFSAIFVGPGIVQVQKFCYYGNVRLQLLFMICVFSLISLILFVYLFRILTSMAGWCKNILSAEQKKSDFRPEEHELGLVQRTVVS